MQIGLSYPERLRWTVCLFSILSVTLVLWSYKAIVCASFPSCSFVKKNVKFHRLHKTVADNLPYSNSLEDTSRSKKCNKKRSFILINFYRNLSVTFKSLYMVLLNLVNQELQQWTGLTEEDWLAKA